MKFKNTARLLTSRLKKLGLSQREFAEIVGVHVQAVSNIKRGLAGIPSFRAKTFAKAMNVPVELLAKAAAKDFYVGYLRDHA